MVKKRIVWTFDNAPIQLNHTTHREVVYEKTSMGFITGNPCFVDRVRNRRFLLCGLLQWIFQRSLLHVSQPLQLLLL